MNIFIDIALSIDRTIYTAIPKVYDLIIRLANYEIFSAETVNGFSRRIYALLGIFMLLKLSFSMISYIVNPDDFADKSKGFGGLIKNVIVTMVLIVAVPYIFAEAFYVQKNILEDGTIVKLIFAQGGSGDESNTDNSSVTYKGDEGEELSFILFTQFVKPNDAIQSIKDGCRRVYKIGDNGQRVKVENEVGAYQLDDECDSALQAAFGGNDNEYQHYVDGLKYQNYEILVNNPDIFKVYAEESMVLNQKNGTTSGKKSKITVISYNWFLSFIFGIVTLLFLVTLCIDVATRTIKLAFYQIIAPVPIISNCDPKAKKDGMFNKWVKACISTYLDLFIRLAMFYLAIFIIKSFTEKFFVSRTSGFVTLFIVLGALVFAKQAPKIVEDLTGLKMEKFTLNPFKKISNEALLPEKVGKAIGKVGLGTLTGAAGGALAGMIGGGRTFGQRMLSGAAGAARGGLKSEGFGAGLHAQADSNRKMREARIAGASFWGGVGAGVGSVFGLDKAHLEKESIRIRHNEDAAKKTYREKIEPKEKKLNTGIKRIEDRNAKAKAAAARHKSVQEAYSAMDKRAGEKIDQSEAGILSTKHHANEIKYQELIQDKQGTGVKYINGKATYMKKGEAETEMFNKMADNNILSGDWTSEIDAVSGLETIYGRDGQVVGTRYSSNSISAYKTKMDNDYQDAKFDYLSACIASEKGLPTYIGTDGNEHSVAEVMGTDKSGKAKTDATIDGTYKELEVRLNNLGDSVVVSDYTYTIDADGNINEHAGAAHNVEAEQGFDRELKVTGKDLKSQFGQSKGVVKAIGNFTLNGENIIQDAKDQIVHLNTTTAVEDLLDEKGNRISLTDERATYARAIDQNARDKAEQDAKIARSDVMHKGYDASKLGK